MKKIVIGTFLFTSLLLSACSIGASTKEKLSDTLANVYKEEQGYRDAQQQLAELEKKEQSAFNASMELTQDQKDEVVLKVEELNALLSERLDLLKVENESIENAFTSLSLLEELIDDTKEEEKAALMDLKVAIETRYQAHKVVSSEYIKLSVLQTELYNILAVEETEQPQLQKQVVKVNEQNDHVQSAINTFNETTKRLNETKESVYNTLSEEK